VDGDSVPDRRGHGYPATKTVIEMKDTTNPDLTIKITGYQWKWRYTYVDDGIDFYSSLSTPRDQIENQAPKANTTCWKWITRWWSRSARRSGS